MLDQADKLRELIGERFPKERTTNHKIKVYSVISGKGGVGKTTFSVNLAIKFQQMGKRVLLLDADIGMSNTNIILGVSTPYHLFHALDGQMSLKDVIVKSSSGVELLSGGSDLFYLEELDSIKQKKVFEELSELDQYDILIIDNGAGITKHTLTFTILADDILLITTPEPTAITDAYRVLKAISSYELKNKVRVVVNQVMDESMGLETFNKLMIATNQFLNIDLENMGYVFNDIRVNKAIMAQHPIVLKYPNALASTNYEQICKKLLGDNNYGSAISNMKQLKNRIIKLFG